MQHECRITVLETKVFPEYQEKYLADPKSGPCPCFQKGDTFLLKRTAEQDDFYHLMNGKFCGEAWDAISRYVYTALQGGSIMHKWTNDERMMIACCNDGTRPVIFKIDRIDIPETEEEKQLETPVSTLLGETVAETEADTVKALSEKLEIINLQFARRKAFRREFLHWSLIAFCALLLAGFAALAVVNSPYLGWDFSDPETAVMGTTLHAFEWGFARLAPFALVAALVGVFLTRKKA